MKKLIFLIALFIVANVSFGQFTITKGTYDAGLSFGVTQTLDSANLPITSNYVDWTLMGSGLVTGEGSIYCSYSLVQANFNHGAGNDTILVIFRGKDRHGNVKNMDTLSIVSNITQATASGVTALSLTSHLPWMAIYVASKHTGGAVIGDNGALKLDIWTNTPRNQIFWK